MHPWLIYYAQMTWMLGLADLIKLREVQGCKIVSIPRLNDSARAVYMVLVGTQSNATLI